MFDAGEELRKWKEELVTRQHELLSKKEKYGRFLSAGEHADINERIEAFAMRIGIVDRALQMHEWTGGKS